MSRRSLLLAALLPLVLPAALPAASLPLDPATLDGAAVFTDSEQLVARAAQAAGLVFTPDPRPLPPQVILPLDTAGAAVAKRNGLLFWRGDMLPDQLAPAESGTLVRKRRQPDGTWKTTRIKPDFALAAHPELLPVVRATTHFTLPRLIIETPYQLGLLGATPVHLVLWRSAEEDSAPLGGAIVLAEPNPALFDALRPLLPPFAAQADWAAEFDALAP